MAMDTEEELAKLEISKNLLQMNFMRRTLSAKEKLDKPPNVETLTSIVDSDFPLKSSIVEMLNKRQQIVSKWPVVRRLPGVNGIVFPGLRASYGGFNLYLENLGNVQPVPSESEVIHKKDEMHQRKPRSKKRSKRKRESIAERSGPAAKKFRRNYPL